jgi:spermidine synthase
VSVVAFALLAGGSLAPRASNVYLARNFFGVLKIQDTTSGVFRTLYHGTTLHGAAQLEKGKPRPGWPEPLTYYHTQSPMAEAIRAAREVGKSVRLSPVGIVGLGAGSLACYRQEGETWHFYEIDADVVHLARDSGYFRFLPACAPDTPIHIGDARITLAESNLKHELLLIDAFSSDAIPIHLLTKEAVQLYFDRLTPNGMLVVHTSNRHLDLLPEVAKIAQDLGLVAWSKQDAQMPDYGPRMLATSQVVVLARNEPALGALPSLEGWHKLPWHDGRAWTDDYSDILSAFLRYLNKF